MPPDGVRALTRDVAKLVGVSDDTDAVDQGHFGRP